MLPTLLRDIEVVSTIKHRDITRQEVQLIVGTVYSALLYVKSGLGALESITSGSSLKSRPSNLTPTCMVFVQ